ncbi:MAG: cytochrome c-type biogenesis protein CcmH [Actinobacteria bacterium]|nr:cytochrome c-type biogenesis protein CcmH [Actinomycetota bacterium]
MSSLLAKGSPLRRWGPWIAVFVVTVAVLSIATFGARSAPTAQDRVTTISRSVKCPVCSGESVAESNAPASQEIRRQIAEQVQQGQTDEEIRSFYAAKYGQAILLTPSASGVNALVWILPIVAFAIGIAALVIVFRRWSSMPAERATDEDRKLVDSALRAEADDSDLDDDPHGEGASR